MAPLTRSVLKRAGWQHVRSGKTPMSTKVKRWNEDLFSVSNCSQYSYYSHSDNNKHRGMRKVKLGHGQLDPHCPHPDMVDLTDTRINNIYILRNKDKGTQAHNLHFNAGTQTFCGSGAVGCVEETEGTTCYCNQNKYKWWSIMRLISNSLLYSCNKNMASAGSLKSEASTGAGGLPGGDGGQASLKVSLVISLVGSILPVILIKLWWCCCYFYWILYL